MLWLAMKIVTPKVLEVVCSWLRNRDMHVLESKVRELYPLFNSSHYLDKNDKKIMVIKEKPIHINQARSEVNF